MARPLIGIPPCLDAAERIRPGRRTHYLDETYARAVEEAGGQPIYLPPVGSPELAAARVDGLLVPGGDDFPPDRPYPESVRFEPVPAEQLAFDAALLGAALARGIPVLGICYGMQLLARHYGGRLIHDIGHDLPEASEHRLSQSEGRHPLRILPGSRLHTILGENAPPVNSLHHQAVAEAGERAVEAAWAPDGVVEALEAEDDAGFVVGVQWHPEKMDGPHRTRLFAHFLRACAEA